MNMESHIFQDDTKQNWRHRNGKVTKFQWRRHVKVVTSLKFGDFGPLEYIYIYICIYNLYHSGSIDSTNRSRGSIGSINCISSVGTLDPIDSK